MRGLARGLLVFWWGNAVVLVGMVVLALVFAARQDDASSEGDWSFLFVGGVLTYGYILAVPAFVSSIAAAIGLLAPGLVRGMFFAVSLVALAYLGAYVLALAFEGSPLSQWLVQWLRVQDFGRGALGLLWWIGSGIGDYAYFVWPAMTVLSLAFLHIGLRNDPLKSQHGR